MGRCLFIPLPKPKPDENEDEFMDRCISSDIMQEEFGEDEIPAICQTIWDTNKSARGDIDVKNKEVRIVSTDFELRQKDEEQKIVGYAAMFNSPAEETNGFIEEIAPGAFQNAIKNSDTRALINHNPEKVLGRLKAGTLNLREDEKGLFYEVDPPATTYAEDLMESMKRGDIDQSSFGFTVAVEEWDDSGDVPVRTIVEVDELFDVSPVTFPWYKNTESGLKSKDEVLREYRNMKKAKEKEEKEKLEIYKKKLKTRRDL